MICEEVTADRVLYVVLVQGLITVDVGWGGTTVTCGDCNGRGY